MIDCYINKDKLKVIIKRIMIILKKRLIYKKSQNRRYVKY